MKAPIFVLSLFSLAILQGCATSYGCKGHPNDPICKSAVESYKATEGPKTVNPSASKEEAQPAPLAAAPSGQKTSGGPTEIAPRMEDPTAIRTAPKVMRIWIAPWEDADGDLQAPSYVFTELEPRRWVIGKPHEVSRPLLKPLQVASRKDPHHAAPETLAEPLQPMNPGASRNPGITSAQDND